MKEIKKETAAQSELLEERPGAEPESSQPTRRKLSFELDEMVEAKLRLLKQNLEKKTKKPQDWNSFFEAFVGEVEELLNSKPTKTEKSRREPKTIPETLAIASRYIPANVRKHLEDRYQGLCAYPTCTRPQAILHHTRRFRLVPNHDPQYLVPLCKNHERLAHLGLIQNETSEPETWKIQKEPDTHSPQYPIDLKVNRFRRARILRVV